MVLPAIAQYMVAPRLKTSVWGVTGFLAEPRDVPQFVSHLLRLAGDAGLRTRMGAAARARALTFSWDETMARLLGYYKGVLSRTRL